METRKQVLLLFPSTWMYILAALTLATLVVFIFLHFSPQEEVIWAFGVLLAYTYYATKGFFINGITWMGLYCMYHTQMGETTKVSQYLVSPAGDEVIACLWNFYVLSWHRRGGRLDKENLV